MFCSCVYDWLFKEQQKLKSRRENIPPMFHSPQVTLNKKSILYYVGTAEFF
jgi:hypothetical protein